MVRTIPYRSFYTKYREAAKNTSLCCFFDTFSNCWDVFLRNCTTDYSRLEDKCLFAVWIHRLEFNFTVSVLSTSTRLFCIFTVNINRCCKCLFVSNLRGTYICLYFEFTKQTVYDDIEVKLTHTCDDCLTSFLICMSTECRIFFCKFCKSFTHFTLVILCLRLDSEFDNRFREFHGLKDYRMLLITDCITRCSYFETNSCGDISGVNLINFVTFVCVHLYDTSYTLFLSFCSIQYVRTGVHCTGIYTEECEFSNEWV